MGFDLMGESGNYFRNNVWWWRRLALFVTEHCDFLTEVDTQEFQWNDGHFIDEGKALQIAAFLRQALKNKEKYEGWVNETAEYMNGTSDSAEQSIAGLCYPFDWENVEEFADFCDESNGFRIC